MAKRTRTPIPKDDQDQLMRICDFLTRKIKETANPTVYSVKGPQHVICKKGPQYRNVPFTGVEELILKGVHLGKRSKHPFIFDFEWIGGTDYDHIEFPQDKVKEALGPAFEAEINSLFGCIVQDAPWEETAGVWLSEQIAEDERLAAEAAAAKLAESQRAYGDDPTWGSF